MVVKACAAPGMVPKTPWRMITWTEVAQLSLNLVWDGVLLLTIWSFLDATEYPRLKRQGLSDMSHRVCGSFLKRRPPNSKRPLGIPRAYLRPLGPLGPYWALEASPVQEAPGSSRDGCEDCGESSRLRFQELATGLGSVTYC